MSATLPLSTAPAKSVRRGFPGIRCPLCGNDDVQSLDLDDLQTFHCGGCEESYTTEDVRELLAGWQKVLTWIDGAPAVEE